MSRFVVLCFLLFALKEAQGQTTRVTKCLRNNGTLPINAYVIGCEEPPCVLHQLDNVAINVVFEAPYLLHNMETKALAIVNFGFPIEIDYNLEASSVTCNFITNSYCPILQNEVVQYTLTMFIETIFLAGITATIEFRVQDQNKVPIWCIRLPIRIARPRPQAQINQST